MSNSAFNNSGKPDESPLGRIRLFSYALLHCNPMNEPPFNLELGFNDLSVRHITDCAHIPDAMEKMEVLCQKENISKASAFTLLYPIYLEAMGTDSEDTMHNIAWLIKEQADKNGWNFGRIGGYTDKTAVDYIKPL